MAVVVVFGLTWTARRRAARKPPSLDDQLNAINAKNIEKQHEREAAQRAKYKASMVPTASPGVLTPELESTARQMLEQCSFFTQPIKFEIPKELTKTAYAELVNKQPMVGGMARLHFIDLEPPPNSVGPYETIEVAPTQEVRSILVIEDGDSLRVDAGRRKLDSVKGSAPTATRMYVSFEWSFEIPVAQDLGDNRSRAGRATMDVDASGAWRILEATVDVSRGRQSVCP